MMCASMQFDGRMRRRIRVNNAGVGVNIICRAALCLTTVLLLLSSSSSNFPTSVMAAETASTTLDNSSSTSNDSGILSSYSAYRAYMNGRAGSDRHRKKSKGKEKKKTTGTAAVKYNKDETATVDEHLLPKLSRDNKLLSTLSSTTHSQQELTLAIAKHRQMQESSTTTATSSSSNLCSCSPTIFTLTFNPTSLDCTTDTLKDNAGIKGTLCLLSDPTSIDSSIKPLLPDTITGSGGGGEGEERMPTVTPTYMNDDEITTSSPTCAGSDCFIPVPVPVPVEGGSTDMPSSSGSLPPASEGGGGSAVPTVMSMGSSSDGPTSSTYAPTYANGGSGSNVPTSSTYRPTYTPTGDTSPGDALIDAATATNNGTARDTATATAGDGDYEMSKKELHQLKKEGATEKLMRTNSASLSSSITTGGMETLIPTLFVTPYPTDDKTYEPTVLPTYLVDDDDQQRRRLFVGDGATSESPTTISHAKNLRDHTTFDLASVESSLKKGIITDDDSRIGRRLLHDKSTFGVWKSIPLNDEFFVTFPEFKSRQEDIYHLRRSEHTASSSSNSVGKRNLNGRGINNRQSEAGDELTLADIAAGNDDFSILLEAVTAADLLGVLSGPDPLTVFGTL